MSDGRKCQYTFSRTPMELPVFVELMRTRHLQFQRMFDKQVSAEQDSGRKRRREEVEKRKKLLETRLEECREKKKKLNEEAAAISLEKEHQAQAKHRLLQKLKQHLAEENKRPMSGVNGIISMKRAREEDDGLKGRYQSPFQKSCPPMTPPETSCHQHASRIGDRHTLPPHLACTGPTCSPPYNVHRLPPHMKSTGQVFDRGSAITDTKGDERNHKISKTAATVLYKR